VDELQSPYLKTLISSIREPSQDLDKLAHVVIGAAIEVHRHLGPGLLEPLYEEAFCLELVERQIPFERQLKVPITYKGHPIGKNKLDLLVGDQLIVEIKAVERLRPHSFGTADLLFEDQGSSTWLVDQFQRPVAKRRNQTRRPLLILAS
jgi:GxxExxY protein